MSSWHSRDEEEEEQDGALDGEGEDGEGGELRQG